MATISRRGVISGAVGASLLLPLVGLTGLTAAQDAPVVIQGRVVAVHRASMSVQTPAQRPSCAAGRKCPTYIVAGRVLTVDLSGAVNESPQGQSLTTAPAVGSAVVVVGVRTGPFALRASVVERIDPTLATLRSPGQP